MHVGWIMDSRMDHRAIAEGDEGKFSFQLFVYFLSAVCLLSGMAAAAAVAPPAGSAAATPPISTGIAIGGSGGGHRQQQLGRRDSFSESVGSLGSR